MKVQLLVSAVDQNAEDLARKMNISSDAIIINQCGREGSEEFTFGGHAVKCMHFAERGVGVSRNRALSFADHEISLFADDDIIYESDYAGKIEEAYRRFPDADMLLFYVKASAGRETYRIDKPGRVRLYNCGRYPTYSFSVKTARVKELGIRFSPLFGGGAPYSNGEDSLFIHDCLKKGMKVYKVPVLIGQESGRESTWFKGYNDKFFYDRGVLYHFLYGAWAKLWAIRFLLAHRAQMCAEKSVREAYGLMKRGIRKGKEEAKA